jgi:hypothetical protein
MKEVSKWIGGGIVVLVAIAVGGVFGGAAGRDAALRQRAAEAAANPAEHLEELAFVMNDTQKLPQVVTADDGTVVRVEKITGGHKVLTYRYTWPQVNAAQLTAKGFNSVLYELNVMARVSKQVCSNPAQVDFLKGCDDDLHVLHE